MFGRLVPTQSPYPDPETAEGQLHAPRFYYDGIRRLQEIVTDPILTLGEAMVSGDPQVQSAAQSAAAGPVELDDSAVPRSLEVAQLESDPITDLP